MKPTGDFSFSFPTTGSGSGKSHIFFDALLRNLDPHHNYELAFLSNHSAEKLSGQLLESLVLRTEKGGECIFSIANVSYARFQDVVKALGFHKCDTEGIFVRFEKCGHPLGLSGYVRIFCKLHKSHQGRHRPF